jgi:hypothetical protein
LKVKVKEDWDSNHSKEFEGRFQHAAYESSSALCRSSVKKEETCECHRAVVIYYKRVERCLEQQRGQ